MSHGRVFSAGSKAFTRIAWAQLDIPTKLEQVPTVIGTFPVERALCECSLSFCRSFSGKIQTSILENEPHQSKLNGFFADGQNISSIPDLKMYFSPFCNESTLSLVLKAIKLMQPGDAEAVCKLAAITQEPTNFTRTLFNVVFRIFLQARNFDSALEVLEEMKKSEVLVNFTSFATLVLSYLKVGMKMEAEDTWDLLTSYGFCTRKGFCASKGIHRILLRKYIEAEDVEGIERLLLKCFEAENLESTLKVVAKLGKTQETLTLIARMHAEGIYADRSTDFEIIKCFCGANMIDEALKYVENVQAQGFLRNIKMLNILIGSLVREKRLDDALRLFSNLRDNECMPNRKTHHILIFGFLNSGDLGKAYMQLEEMKSDGWRPTSETLKLFIRFLV